MIFGNALQYRGGGSKTSFPTYVPPANPPYVKMDPAVLAALNWVGDGTGTADPPLMNAALPKWNGVLYAGPAGFLTSSVNTTCYSTRFQPGNNISGLLKLNIAHPIVMNFFDMVLDGSNTWQLNYNFFGPDTSSPYFNNGSFNTIPNGAYAGIIDPRSFSWSINNLPGAFGSEGLACNLFNTPVRFNF